MTDCEGLQDSRKLIEEGSLPRRGDPGVHERLKLLAPALAVREKRHASRQSLAGDQSAGQLRSVGKQSLHSIAEHGPQARRVLWTDRARSPLRLKVTGDLSQNLVEWEQRVANTIVTATGAADRHQPGMLFLRTGGKRPQENRFAPSCFARHEDYVALAG